MFWIIRVSWIQHAKYVAVVAAICKDLSGDTVASYSMPYDGLLISYPSDSTVAHAKSWLISLTNNKLTIRLTKKIIKM